MDRQLVPGVEVEHAGRRWRVHRALGPDAVLLTNEAGETVSVSPARLVAPEAPAITTLCRALDERHYTDTQWAEAARRHELLANLARQPARSRTQVDDIAKELGIRRRRVYALLGFAAAGSGDVAAFPRKQCNLRAKRLAATVEAIIRQATDEHYAQASRPSLASLQKTVAGRCAAAGLPAPSTRAVQSRIRDRDQARLTRRREGPKAARTLRLLTGAHPGAAAPWERVQIDGTPCDILLVREDRTASSAGPTSPSRSTFLYSRAAPGFSVSLEAASTTTVATCLAPPAQGRLARQARPRRRALAGLRQAAHLGVRPGTLTDPGMAQTILVAAGGLIGGIASLLRQAAVEATRTGHECIDRTMLDRAHGSLPARIEAIADAAFL